MGNILTPEIITKEMRLSYVIQLIQEEKIMQNIQKKSLSRKLNRYNNQLKKMIKNTKSNQTVNDCNIREVRYIL